MSRMCQDKICSANGTDTSIYVCTHATSIVPLAGFSVTNQLNPPSLGVRQLKHSKAGGTNVECAGVSEPRLPTRRPELTVKLCPLLSHIIRGIRRSGSESLDGGCGRQCLPGRRTKDWPARLIAEPAQTRSEEFIVVQRTQIDRDPGVIRTGASVIGRCGHDRIAVRWNNGYCWLLRHGRRDLHPECTRARH